MLAALTIMRELPAGKERTDALAPLKASGALTNAAVAHAGLRDGGERGYANVEAARINDPLQRSK